MNKFIYIYICKQFFFLVFSLTLNLTLGRVTNFYFTSSLYSTFYSMRCIFQTSQNNSTLWVYQMMQIMLQRPETLGSSLVPPTLPLATWQICLRPDAKSPALPTDPPHRLYSYSALAVKYYYYWVAEQGTRCLGYVMFMDECKKCVVRSSLNFTRN